MTPWREFAMFLNIAVNATTGVFKIPALNHFQSRPLDFSPPRSEVATSTSSYCSRSVAKLVYFLGLIDFLTHGAPLRAPCAHELRKKWFNIIGSSTVASTIVEPRFTITLFYTTTLFTRTYSFHPNLKITELFHNSATPLMRPPRYCDQDFMAQRW